jgi:hypothetical protein
MHANNCMHKTRPEAGLPATVEWDPQILFSKRTKFAKTNISV